MPTGKLTDRDCKLAKPAEKPYHLYDGRYLYLDVSPRGKKSWRVMLRVMRGGKYVRYTTVTIGTYPELSLAEARKLRDKLLFEQIHPLAARTKLASTVTVAELARQWLETRQPQLTPEHLRGVRQRVESYILPAIGNLPLSALDAPTAFELLERIAEERSPETAKRVKIALSQMLRYGVAIGVAERDVTVDFRGQLPTAPARHYPAPTDPETIGRYLRLLWSYYGVWRPVEVAVRLLPYLFVRSGELRSMRWRDIDFDAGLWSFTASKTKTPHVVPLPRQAIELLETLPRRSSYVFPSPRSSDRPISDNALVAAYRSLGISSQQLVPHSWRAIARTLLEERLGYPPHVIELQLAHTVRDPLGRAYNRTTHLETRVEMMQRYADWLDELRTTTGENTDGKA